MEYVGYGTSWPRDELHLGGSRDGNIYITVMVHEVHREQQTKTRGTASGFKRRFTDVLRGGYNTHKVEAGVRGGPFRWPYNFIDNAIDLLGG